MEILVRINNKMKEERRRREREMYFCLFIYRRVDYPGRTERLIQNLIANCFLFFSFLLGRCFTARRAGEYAESGPSRVPLRQIPSTMAARLPQKTNSHCRRRQVECRNWQFAILIHFQAPLRYY